MSASASSTSTMLADGSGASPHRATARAEGSSFPMSSEGAALGTTRASARMRTASAPWRTPDTFMNGTTHTRSRLATSTVWSRATRPGPADYDGTRTRATKPRSPTYIFASTNHDGANILPFFTTAAPHASMHALGTMHRSAVSHIRSPPRVHMGTSVRDDAAALYSIQTYKPK